MLFPMEKIKNMPFSAKTGIALWIACWVWFLGAYNYVTKDAENVFKFAIAVGLLAVFMLQIRNWARMLAMMANTLGILFSYYYFHQGFVKIAVVNIILCGAAIYYLIIPKTAQFFKANSPPGAKEPSQGGSS